MGRVYLCLGQNAELPYYFEKAKVHIWNIEELCYFIRENAWIMEPELLTKELIDWVAQQCGLPKLAVLLNDSLKEEDCVTAFAACLFSYTGYCPQEQALQVQKILQTNAGNNETDRAKARGDYFLESGKYFRSLQEYETLMSPGAKIPLASATKMALGIHPDLKVGSNVLVLARQRIIDDINGKTGPKMLQLLAQ